MYTFRSKYQKGDYVHYVLISICKKYIYTLNAFTRNPYFGLWLRTFKITIFMKMTIVFTRDEWTKKIRNILNGWHSLYFRIHSKNNTLEIIMVEYFFVHHCLAGLPSLPLSFPSSLYYSVSIVMRWTKKLSRHLYYSCV